MGSKEYTLNLYLPERFALLTLSLALWAGLGAIAEASIPGEEGPQLVRVGVYENPPKIFVDDRGQISGVLGDLLAAIAQREGWVLEPVPCIWQECLALLEEGALDLMPDVALTELRAERFAFHRVPALLSWSQIYEVPGQNLTSLLDLQGRRLAVLSGSVQEFYLRGLMDSFGLKVTWVQVNSMEEGFQAVVAGRADAVAANHFFGEARARALNLNKTPLVFEPDKLFYSAPLNQNQLLLERIDDYLIRWRNEAGSPYFDILHRWDIQQETRQLPAILWWGIALLGAALISALGFSVLLRRQVAEKTRGLSASEQRLNTILDSVDAYIYIKGPDLRYQYVNKKVCDLLGLSREQILGQTDEQFFDAQSCRSLIANDRRVLDRAERVAGEDIVTLANSDTTQIFLSMKLPLLQRDGSPYALCGISTDITEYRQILSRVHQLEFFDPLTGLANRRLMLDRLRHALASQAETGYQGALLLIDLDDFKGLNDTLGHESGDLLLQQLARRLEMEMRSTDMPARIGPDEFVMILEDLSRVPEKAMFAARRLGEDLLARLAKPYDLNGAPYVASVSIGVIMFSDTESNADELLKGVDLALHAAKAEGRNTMRFFNPSMQAKINRRNLIEGALRRAIDNDCLELHIQPLVMADDRVFGMEALLRWQDAELGRMSPGDFIPVAEASGLIIPLGKWVLEKACSLLARWSLVEGLEDLTLAVNISPEQFRAPDYVVCLEECLLRHAIDPARLKLEITENLLIDDMDSTVERMLQLRARRICFSLDDFGTGYASLSYLKRLPLSQLKIDQSFVRDLLFDPSDEAIVRAIIALGESLQLEVIAEGVETLEQANRLRELGCQAFQGYFFGRPEAAALWEGRLKKPS